MSGKDSTNAVKRAKAEIDTIVKLAQDNLLKESEDKIHRMIEEALDEAQKEEDTATPGAINEMLKLETDDMKVTIDDDGSVSVDHKEPEVADGAAVSDSPVDAVTQQPVAASAPAVTVDATPVEPTPVDVAGDDEEIQLSDDEEEIQIASEAEQTTPDMNTTPATPAPAEPAAMPAPEAAPAPVEAPAEGESPEEMIMKGIKAMIDQATGGDAGTDDGQVDIVDDEAGAVAPAPAAAPAPAMEEMIELEESDELVELELEEDEEVMDEVKAMGTSHAINRTAGPHTAPTPAAQNRTRDGQKVNENKKNTAQHEAKLAELTKENQGLKDQLNEFRSAFIDLREQFNEAQDFTRKLAFAYRIVANGGLSDKEKVRISERFENAKDANEAEKIYKEILAEKNMTAEKKPVFKSSAIPVAKPSAEKSPIYESKEVKRARVLAGITKPEE